MSKKKIAPSYTIKVVPDRNNPPRQLLSPYLASQTFHNLMGDLPHEEVHIITIDPASYVTGTFKVAQGGGGMAEVAVKDIFRPAIAHNAFAIMIGHNHPEGEAAPSEDDLKFTELMMTASSLLGIQLVDHIIINEQGESYSMKEHEDMEDE